MKTSIISMPPVVRIAETGWSVRGDIVSALPAVSARVVAADQQGGYDVV